MGNWYIWSQEDVFADSSIVGTSHKTKEKAEAFLTEKGFKPVGHDEWDKGMAGVFITSEEDYRSLIAS